MAGQLVQANADCAQNGVGRRLPEGVVDLGETFQVHQQEAGDLRVDNGKQLAQAVHEVLPVHQTRDVVGVCELTQSSRLAVQQPHDAAYPGDREHHQEDCHDDDRSDVQRVTRDQLAAEDDRADGRGHPKHRQAKRVEPQEARRLRRGRLAHGRVQGCRTPQHVRHEPPEVEQVPMGGNSGHEKSHGENAVGHNQSADRARHEDERRVARPRRGREPDQYGKEQDVAERICDADESVAERFLVGGPDRLHEEHPCQQSHADREDRGLVQPGGLLGRGPAAPTEQQQGGGQRWVHARWNTLSSEGSGAITAPRSYQPYSASARATVAAPVASRYHTAGWVGRFLPAPTRIAAALDRPMRQ